MEGLARLEVIGAKATILGEGMLEYPSRIQYHGPSGSECLAIAIVISGHGSFFIG